MTLSTKSKVQDYPNTKTIPYWRAIVNGLNEPRNLYDALIPMYLFTKCVGLSPFTYNIINGQTTLRPSLLGSGYSIAITLIFVGK